MRLDFYISGQFNLSREESKRLIEEGKALVNNKIINKASTKINEEDIVEVTQMPSIKPSSLKPSDINLDIVYEDEYLMVINKQAGVSTHPPSMHGEGTIANGVVSLFAEEGLRPGIVHRLDKDTTGLLIIAKQEEAKKALSKMIEDRMIERKYLALCYGCPRLPSFQINANIIRDAVNRQKMKICKTAGRAAITNVKLVECMHNKEFSLLELKLETGRTHQIRVHLAHQNLPIIGDGVYGIKPPSFFNRFTPYSNLHKLLTTAKRQMLHAYSLKFVHPFYQTDINLEINPPSDFTEILKELKSINLPI